MVIVALWLHWPLLAWGAFGAFWVCLADPGGSDAVRLRALGGFTFGGTLIAWAASTAAGLGPLTAGIALLPLTFLASLSRAYGPAAAQSGMLVCVVAVVAVAFPRPPLAALTIAAVFLLGSLWALVLCLVVWRTHPHAPARRAIASVFARMADMTADLLTRGRYTSTVQADWPALNAAHRRSVRDAIERARDIVLSLETGQTRYHYELAQVDRIFAGLIAIGHHLGKRATPLDDGAERHLLHRLLLSLAEARYQAARRISDSRLLLGQADMLATISSQLDTEFGRPIAASAQVLHDLAQSWIMKPGHAASPTSLPSKPPRQILRPISATVLRHASRLAVAVVITYAIAVWLDLAFSYWATMATVVVLQPFAATTWPRSIERVLGSVFGGLLAAAITVLLPTKLGLLASIFPMTAATIAFRFVSYTLYVFFLTPLFVLVSELLQPSSGIASARAINNIIGTLIGAGASFLLWPDHDARTTTDILAEAVMANFAYAESVVGSLKSTQEQVDQLRRKAGIASNMAEATRHRMVLEGRRRGARLDEMGTLLEALRMLAGAATTQWLRLCPPDESRAAYFREISEALAHSLRHPSRAPEWPAAPNDMDDLNLAAKAVVATLAAYVLGTPPPDEHSAVDAANERDP
ncbi:MAG TPA: FUSC family protein [Acidocella sp.]|jgi:uncharacterized membrane protein YccC|nr:FUSC family protein [Acidocella sp.]